MNEIMISIQPQWVAKILNGEKTIEIRKTMPKCKLPIKVYIYCTKNEKQYFSNVKCCESLLMDSNSLGKVVAEFTLDKVDKYTAEFVDDDCYEDIRVYIKNEYAEYEDELYDEEIVTTNCEENPSDCELCIKSCVSYEQIKKYVGVNFHDKPFYAWHIDNLKIYDKPKELSEFKKQNACYVAGSWEELGCWECGCTFQELDDCDGRCSRLERPPQSWCYVESICQSI